MDKKEKLTDNAHRLLTEIKALQSQLNNAYRIEYNRSLPFGEIITDRWERAQLLNFGKGTSIYDSSVVIGDVLIGGNCWIGPNTMLDGSGGLRIGNYVTIASGVHIYTHDNIKRTLSSEKLPIEHLPVTIQDNVYLGAGSIINKGVIISSYAVIGANSFVNCNIPERSIFAGSPAKQIGRVCLTENDIILEYF